jgi:hypothetical protein
MRVCPGHDATAQPMISLRPDAYCHKSGKIKAVKVHHFAPHLHEVMHELRLSVRTSVDFGKRAELGVRAEDEIDAGPGPFHLVALAIAAFEQMLSARGRLGGKWSGCDGAHGDHFHRSYIY